MLAKIKNTTGGDRVPVSREIKKTGKTKTKEEPVMLGNFLDLRMGKSWVLAISLSLSLFFFFFTPTLLR